MPRRHIVNKYVLFHERECVAKGLPKRIFSIAKGSTIVIQLYQRSAKVALPNIGLHYRSLWKRILGSQVHAYSGSHLRASE
jgi:hypothetical protein